MKKIDIDVQSVRDLEPWMREHNIRVQSECKSSDGKRYFFTGWTYPLAASIDSEYKSTCYYKRNPQGIEYLFIDTARPCVADKNVIKHDLERYNITNEPEIKRRLGIDQ